MHLFFQVPHISDMIFIFVWLTSPSIKISRFIHVADNGIISLCFLMAEKYSNGYMYHIFIYSSIEGHLGCFHVLAIIKRAIVSIGVHYIFTLWFSSDICTRAGLQDHTLTLFSGVFFFVFFVFVFLPFLGPLPRHMEFPG